MPVRLRRCNTEGRPGHQGMEEESGDGNRDGGGEGNGHEHENGYEDMGNDSGNVDEDAEEGGGEIMLEGIF